jgi:hypothetical protein
VLSTALAASGVGRTLVTDSGTDATQRFDSASIRHTESRVAVPDELRTAFHESMLDEFHATDAFAKGSGLQVDYRYISFTSGSRVQRWFSGGIGNAGEAFLIVEVRFLDPDEQLLSTVQVERRIGSGFFGGSVKSAVGQAAREAA